MRKFNVERMRKRVYRTFANERTYTFARKDLLEVSSTESLFGPLLKRFQKQMYCKHGSQHGFLVNIYQNENFLDDTVKITFQLAPRQ